MSERTKGAQAGAYDGAQDGVHDDPATWSVWDLIRRADSVACLLDGVPKAIVAELARRLETACDLEEKRWTKAREVFGPNVAKGGPR